MIMALMAHATTTRAATLFFCFQPSAPSGTPIHRDGASLGERVTRCLTREALYMVFVSSAAFTCLHVFISLVRFLPPLALLSRRTRT